MRDWENTDGSTPLSAHPPTPSATARVVNWEQIWYQRLLYQGRGCRAGASWTDPLLLLPDEKEVLARILLLSV